VKISRAYLEQHAACDEGVARFLKEAPDEEVEYQYALDVLAAKGGVSFARWLIDVVGSSGEITEYCPREGTPGHLFFAGDVHFCHPLSINGTLLAAGRVFADAGVSAGGGIVAAEIVAVGAVTSVRGGVAATRGGISCERVFAADDLCSAGDVDAPGGITAGRSISAAGSLMGDVKAGVKVPDADLGLVGTIEAAQAPSRILRGRYVGVRP
jgi:hypothetical protein